MKLHIYLLLLIVCAQPSFVLKAHSHTPYTSCEPSAPTLEEITYAPSAPSKEEFETPQNRSEFDPEELQEATRRSLEDQNNKFEIDKKSRMSIGVVIMLILIYLNVLAKSDK